MNTIYQINLKNNKLNYIKTNNILELQLKQIKNNINFNDISYKIKSNNATLDTSILIDNKINNKELKSILKKLINIQIKFEVFLINFNVIINLLNIKVIKITYNNLNDKLIIEKNTYTNFNNFIAIEKELKKFINHKAQNNSPDIQIKKFFLIIKNFPVFNIKLNILLNLLCAFGNISTVYYNFFNNEVYFKFKKVNSINNLMNNKNLLVFENDKLLDINLINSDDTNYKNFIKKISFTKKINLNNKINLNLINPPSDTILILNIKYCLEIFYLYKLISKYALPLKLKFIYRANNSKTKMLLVKFPNISEAINTIIHLNNKKISNFLIKIYFMGNQNLEVKPN